MRPLNSIDAIAVRSMTGLCLRVEEVVFELKAPFAITGHIFTEARAVHATLTKSGVSGRGEAVGVYYLGETSESMAAQLQAVAGDVPRSVSLNSIQDLLAPGGARNALDCAMWDYLAKSVGNSIWDLLGVGPRCLTTVFTLGIAEPNEMADAAIRARVFPNLKIKLNADRPVERLEAIRAARPDAALIVDVNQGWTFYELKEYAPAFKKLGVEMIEQPLPRGGDQELDGYTSPVPLGADESCLHMGEFGTAAPRYQVINIKLDKAGGLTEALKLMHAANDSDLRAMVGNMIGSSLSMAPAYVIGQRCQFVDIDGPLLLAKDVDHAIHYGEGGRVDVPERALWG